LCLRGSKWEVEYTWIFCWIKKGRTFRIVFFGGVGVEAYLWFGLIFNWNFFRTRERVMLCEASSTASFSTLGSGGTWFLRACSTRVFWTYYEAKITSNKYRRTSDSMIQREQESRRSWSVMGLPPVARREVESRSTEPEKECNAELVYEEASKTSSAKSSSVEFSYKSRA
jgi:hypothetical protein